MFHRARTGSAGHPRRLITCSRGHSSMVIGHKPTAVAEVRRWVVGMTRATPSRSHDVALAASELVTNALRHTRSGDKGGRVVVELLTTAGQYTLRVTDEGPRPGEEGAYPRLCEDLDPERVGGMGLHLVKALATDWEWTLNTDRTVTVQAHIPGGRGRR